MQKYNVTISKYFSKTITIDAENTKHAVMKVKLMFDDGEIGFSDNDWQFLDFDCDRENNTDIDNTQLRTFESARISFNNKEK